MEHVNRISDNLQDFISSVPVEWAREKIQYWAFDAERTLNEAGYPEDYKLTVLESSNPEGYLFVYLCGEDGYYRTVDVIDWTEAEWKQDRWEMEQYFAWAFPSETIAQYAENHKFDAMIEGNKNFRNKTRDFDLDTDKPYKIGERYHPFKVDGGGQDIKRLMKLRNPKRLYRRPNRSHIVSKDRKSFNKTLDFRSKLAKAANGFRRSYSYRFDGCSPVKPRSCNRQLDEIVSPMFYRKIKAKFLARQKANQK